MGTAGVGPAIAPYRAAGCTVRFACQTPRPHDSFSCEVQTLEDEEELSREVLASRLLPQVLTRSATGYDGGSEPPHRSVA